MEIEPGGKLNSSAKVAAHIANRSFLSKSSGKGSICISNSLDDVVELEEQLDEQIKAPKSTNDIRVAEADDPDATDYSSSFDGTVSGTENYSGLSDAEVESCFYGDNGFTFDGFSRVFPMRKKKLTNHWRSFIRPLMWRCKWTELKIKQFQSQVSNYTREIAAYDERKQLELDQFTSENFGSKSLPFTFQSCGRKAMRRRKRKRFEDTTDIISYMSQHNLFSYRENKRSDRDGTSVAEGFGNSVFADQKTAGHDEFGIHNDDDCSFHESKQGNDSLEEVLRKIEMVVSRVHKLKSRLVMIAAENSMKFSSSENLSLLVPYDGDGQISYAPSPTLSSCNGDTTSLGALYTPNQFMSDYDAGDFLVPESLVSTYGEAIFVPDIIESTVNLLSSSDVTMHQPQIGDSCEAIMDNIQIHNQADEVGRHTTTEMQKQTIAGHQETEESGNPSSVPVIEPELVAKTAAHHEQSKLTSCLASEIQFPKSKRKRGERRAGSGGWS